MKKSHSLFFAGVLMSALCVAFVACGERDVPESKSNRVESEFVIANGLEYESDLIVEMEDGTIITIKSGEEQVILSYVEAIDNTGLLPVISPTDEMAVSGVEMKAYGKSVPDAVWEHNHWEFSNEEHSDNDADYKYTATLFVTNELLKTLNGPEPDTFVTENYSVVNRTASELVVRLEYGDERVTSIKPGDEAMVGSMEYRYEWGFAYSRDRKLLRAGMTIDGETVPDTIWWYDNWERLREDGEDEYHYSILYTLIVTDELLKTIKTNNQN